MLETERWVSEVAAGRGWVRVFIADAAIGSVGNFSIRLTTNLFGLLFTGWWGWLGRLQVQASARALQEETEASTGSLAAGLSETREAR